MATIINGSDGFNTNDVLTQTEFDNEDSGWLYPVFENQWADYGSGYSPARYRKIGNIVHIQGLVKNGTIGSTSSVFTLPVGFRPPVRLLLATTTNNNVHARYDITADGKVVPYAGSNSWYSVSCTFMVD